MTHTHIDTHTLVYIYIYIHIYIYMLYTYLYIYIYTCMNTSIYVLKTKLRPLPPAPVLWLLASWLTCDCWLVALLTAFWLAFLMHLSHLRCCWGPFSIPLGSILEALGHQWQLLVVFAIIWSCIDWPWYPRKCQMGFPSWREHHFARIQHARLEGLGKVDLSKIERKMSVLGCTSSYRTVARYLKTGKEIPDDL